MEELTSELGRRLTALPVELVWATAWQHDANVEIAPRVGLAQLPVVEWRDTSVAEDDEDEYFGLHWKTRLLVEWAGGRDFVWVDDEVTDADGAWIAEHHGGRALVHRVRRPAVGLTDVDFEVLEGWLAAPNPAPAPPLPAPPSEAAAPAGTSRTPDPGSPAPATG
ncbi:hypothetical protein GCM10009839_84440 [Catenulispora yoronensis]|uniref:Uncharacterized protein n=2 Tax=Catenulispora yoronensis TaxID=450799 RepID=A0ABP5H5R1_9ACTN